MNKNHQNPLIFALFSSNCFIVALIFTHGPIHLRLHFKGVYEC